MASPSAVESEERWVDVGSVVLSPNHTDANSKCTIRVHNLSVVRLTVFEGDN